MYLGFDDCRPPASLLGKVYAKMTHLKDRSKHLLLSFNVRDIHLYVIESFYIINFSFVENINCYLY